MQGPPPQPAQPQDVIAVRVWRGDAAGGRFQRFDAPRYENQTVLDVVAWVQQNADPTLAYRFACRVGMCGSCAMMVNGAPRWTCRTHVGKVAASGALTIEPLRNLPVIKDLAVDMEPFFDKWTAAEGVFHPVQTRSDAVAGDRAGQRRAAGGGCGRRMHQLRGVLCCVRYGDGERRFPRAGGAQPRVDFAQ